MSCYKPYRFLLGFLSVLILSLISPVNAAKLTNGQTANYLEYSTLLGGNDRDFFRNIIPSGDGGVLAVMYSISSGFYSDKTTQPDYDTFILRMNNNGTVSNVIGPLGGSGNDMGETLAIDTNGDILLAGYTNSTDLPVTSHAISTALYGGSNDAFLMRLSSDGSQIKYCSYLGGQGYESISSIKLDSTGDILLTGQTNSANFPVTVSALDTTYNGGLDIFLMKLTNACDSVLFSTFIGGSSDETYIKNINLDADGNIQLAGGTNSTNFPVTLNAYDTNYNGGYSDVFALKISADGTSLIYSTFLGGSSDDYSMGSDILPDGRLILTGYSSSTNYPVTANAYDKINTGLGDGLFTILKADGSGLDYSTFIGGNYSETGWNISTDTIGFVTLIGQTGGLAYFPCSPGAMDTTQNGRFQIYIVRMDTRTNTMVHSTLFGGPDHDYAYSVAQSFDGSVWVAGWTESSTAFPCTVNSLQTTFKGGAYDGFIAKVKPGWYLQPKFSSVTVRGVAPLSVPFMDETMGAPNSWNWNFGDGQTSTIKNPTHTYTTAGRYSVSLSVANSLSTTTFGQINYIHVYGSSTIDFPAIKLVLGESLPNALAVSDYDPVGQGPYTLSGNFLGLGTLSNGTISLSSWNQPTTGYLYIDLNSSGQINTARIPIKITTYRISKLPHFAFPYTSSVYIDMSQYVTSSAGPAIPESFGNDSSLIYDHKLLNVTWINPTTLFLSITGYYYRGYRLSVDIIASPKSEPPYGPDMDKERFDTWSNELPIGDMMDTTQWVWGDWGKEMLADYSATPEWGYLPQIIDSKGQIASDVWRFSFTSTNQAIKLTPSTNQWRYYSENQWGIARMRLMSPTPNNDLQVGLFNFNGTIPNSPHVDIACNILFGVPTVWTWIEAPVYTQEPGRGYVQLILKPGTKQSVLYIDEINIMDDIPYVIDTRSQSALKYPYRSFSSLTDLSYGWSTTEGDCPLNIVDDAVQFDFSKATTGIQYGKKLTAQLNQTGVYTPSSMPDHEVGFKAYVEKTAGALDSYGSIVLMALYGVPSNGSYDFWSTGGQLMASAEFGRINDGYHYVIGPGRNGYHQFQFIANSDVVGKINVSDIDFLRDLDDPYFGDLSLW